MTAYMPGVLWTNSYQLQFTITSWSDYISDQYGAVINWYYSSKVQPKFCNRMSLICADDEIELA